MSERGNIMQGTIVLSRPILIDGNQVKELDYSLDEITPALFAEAEAMKNKESGASRFQGGAAGTMELDYSFHLYLGAAAIIAVNPGWTFEDILRVKGQDIYKLMGIGRSFMMPSDDSQEDSYEEPSEITQEYSMSQDQNYEEEESEDF